MTKNIKGQEKRRTAGIRTPAYKTALRKQRKYTITAPPKCPPKVSAICQADTGSAARRHCNLSAEQYAPGKTKAINPNSGKDECNNRKRHLRINGSPEMPFLHIV